MMMPNKPRLSKNLAALWSQLSQPGGDHIFDVLIVGSGYGGSVAAAALAGLSVTSEAGRRPLSVCVLERGQEYLPGDFPQRFEDMPGHLRLVQQNTGQVSAGAEGLFDLRLGDDVVALVANGLGGGSLINAGVMLAPRRADFAAGSVLHGLVAALHDGNYFQRALQSLGGQIWRGGNWVDNTIKRHASGVAGAGQAGLAKTQALSALAQQHPFEWPPITVAMDAPPNSAGVLLTPCTLCGDCMTGCNVGAKNSLDTNLLETAAAGGVSIFTGASVLSLRRSRADEQNEQNAHGAPGDRQPRATDGGHWMLRVVHSAPKLQAREADYLRVRARKVILAGGTLGSPEILLRSRDEKLLFSTRLGESFSCNGDNIAAVHAMAVPTGGCADQELGLGDRQVGPTITGSIHMGAQNGEQRSFLVQEFSVPGALKQLFEEVVTTAHLLARLPEADGRCHGAESPALIDPLAVDPAQMQRTLLVGIIGHDEAAGTLHLARPLRPLDRPPQQGVLRIHWPDAKNAASWDYSHLALERLVASLAKAQPVSTQTQSRPTLIANPMWRLLPPKLADLVSQPRGPVLTVHPLGGCAMGSNSANGVVDDCGRVFDPLAPPLAQRPPPPPPPPLALALAQRQPLPPTQRQPQDQAQVQALDDASWFGSLVVLDGSIFPGSLGVNPALSIAATARRAMAALIIDWNRQGWPELAGSIVREPPAGLPRHRQQVPPPARASRATRIEIVERLSGRVDLALGLKAPRPCVLELTLPFKPVPVRQLMTTLRRGLQVNASDDRARLRLYDLSVWDHQGLRLLDDRARAPHLLFDARLSGRLDFLHREASTARRRSLRGAWAWLQNRGLRDSWPRFAEQGDDGERFTLADVLPEIIALFKMATHAGEVRRFDYRLELGAVLRNHLQDEQGRPSTVLRQGSLLTAAKRLTYNRRANPWRQLTELNLLSLPGWRADGPGLLGLDTGFLVRQGYPLLRITEQQDHGQALADLLSLGLHLARVLISTHLWTLRKPDRSSDAEPVRLPGRIAGVAEPHITELVVDRVRKTGQLVKIRLTRYQPTAATTQAKPGPPRPPLVMIHGYSVGGNTFTHPSLAPSAAAFFCAQGREVWVLDLRTSIGMPTAAMPWAMEQVGLIDIPAALLHIRHVTQQPVDVLAHCIGCVMLSMALLTEARDIRSNETELGVDTWLTEEHLGNLAAFNRREPAGSGHHACIRRIILSQKGPVLRYTDNNVLRAFIMQSLRRLLLNEAYQFRPSRNAGVADQLLDRLLASMPYPDADYDVENPLWPCKRTPWTASRHRMDALYGRDFNAANLSDATLAAIDDLFGAINLDTVAQTIHFTRCNAITSQQGRGEYVTRRHLRERWGAIPTLALHGRENGLVDVGTQNLLGRRLAEAGVPVEVKSPDVWPYCELGHQDLLIGRHAPVVFQDIENFLLQAAPVPTRGAAVGHGWVVCACWLGPRLDLFDPFDPLTLPAQAGQMLGLAGMSRPDQGRARLVLFPVLRQPSVAGLVPVFTLQGRAADLRYSALGDNRVWLLARPELAVFDALPKYSGAAAPAVGVLALLMYSADEVAGLDDAAFLAAPGLRLSPAPPAPAAASVDLAAWWAAVQRWLPLQTLPTLETSFVRLDDMQRALALAVATPAQPRPSFSFALASCQYPPGLFDREPAQASLLRLGQALNEPSTDVDFLLLLGDQIYADASAGLLDSTRRDELFEQPHDKALRLPALREVLRRRPVHMLLDDHELSDNWEPLSPAAREQRPDDRLRNDSTRHHGMQAWRKYQRMRPLPRGARGDPCSLLPGDFEFSLGGHAFYFADTRSGRSCRDSQSLPQDRQILGAAQWLDLEAWLLRRGDEVKFVAMPSLLLPRREYLQQDPQRCTSSDAWDGFPASMARLFGFLCQHQLHNTVFVSGDEHHSLLTEFWLHAEGSAHRPLKCVSVHSSALYAPFSFANGRASELALDEEFSIDNLQVKVRTPLAAPGDGYARISVLQELGGALLALEFVKAQHELAADRPQPLRVTLS